MEKNVKYRIVRKSWSRYEIEYKVVSNTKSWYKKIWYNSWYWHSIDDVSYSVNNVSAPWSCKLFFIREHEAESWIKYHKTLDSIKAHEKGAYKKLNKKYTEYKETQKGRVKYYD